jgi:uncharacterized protein YerC
MNEESLKELIDIATMRLNGKTYREIGQKYGVSRQAIQQRLAFNANNPITTSSVCSDNLH